jgi:hypothetical protein
MLAAEQRFEDVDASKLHEHVTLSLVVVFRSSLLQVLCANIRKSGNVQFHPIQAIVKSPGLTECVGRFRSIIWTEGEGFACVERHSQVKGDAEQSQRRYRGDCDAILSLDYLLLLFWFWLGLLLSVVSLIQMDLIAHVLQVDRVSQVLIRQSEPSRLVRQQLLPLRGCALLCAFLGRQQCVIEQPLHWVFLRGTIECDGRVASGAVHDEQK